MNSPGKAAAALALLAGASLLLPRPAAAQKTYIAVGDSLAYGFKSFNPTPNQTTPGGPGFPGYASLYRNTLESQTGTTYSLINLGIVGETSGTLFTTTTPGGTPDTALNSHYSAGDTQLSLLNQSIAAAGSQLGVITIQVGANDVLQALETNGNPLTAIANVKTNYDTLLTQIRTDEGGGMLSNVTIIDYYDPYANLAPTSPLNAQLKAVSGPLTAQLDATLAGEATMFGARFVDLSLPFAAHLANYDDYVLANSTQDAIPDGKGGTFPNDHPTDQGYALIAQTLAAPEPSQVSLYGLGALGLAGMTLRARRRRA